MGVMYRYAKADADQLNPYYPLPTRRAPGNVPYIVDNLWEWKRPKDMPSRRHCVCASPQSELAAQAGGAHSGRVFSVKVTNARTAQIPQVDARYHPEVKTLPRLLLRHLEQPWVDGPAKMKMPESLLWTPCLSQSEVEELFKTEKLSPFRDEIWSAINFWDDARPVRPGADWPFEQGEIFFEAESWELFSTDSV